MAHVPSLMIEDATPRSREPLDEQSASHGRANNMKRTRWNSRRTTSAWCQSTRPGVNTPRNDGLAALDGLTPIEVAERSAGNLLPVPRVEPEDVAAAVVFLASDHARFITGSQLVLDAGLLTR